jgi:hypothetical protein
MADEESLDDYSIDGGLDAADHWLAAQGIAAGSFHAEEQLEISQTTQTLRAQARLAEIRGICFRGLKAEILKLAQDCSDLQTNRDIAERLRTTRPRSTEGSIKDARREIRKRLLNP